MKFKVGDKVVLRKDLEVNETYTGITLLQGMEKELKEKVLTVSHVWFNERENAFRIDVEESGFILSENMLEPAVKTFTKQDLKAGMVVEDTCGTFWFVVNAREGLYALEILNGKLENCQIPINDALNDDLTYKKNGYNPSGDIVRVYDMPKYGWQINKYEWFRKEQPIYERKPLKKITKQELKALGYELIKEEE